MLKSITLLDGGVVCIDNGAGGAFLVPLSYVKYKMPDAYKQLMRRFKERATTLRRVRKYIHS